MPDDPHLPARQAMVATQLRRRGLHDERVLLAMERVPRHIFLDEPFRRYAYDDEAVPLGYGQTISQPFIVAYMLEHLEVAPNHRVLEVGTGTGYQAALLAELAREVYTIERIPELYDTARRILSDLGYTNVDVILGDGTIGIPDRAPFDRVIVAAGAPQVPPALFSQLVEGGRMVLPIGSSDIQQLVLVRKINGTQQVQELEGVRFVPLVGAQGFNHF